MSKTSRKRWRERQNARPPKTTGLPTEAEVQPDWNLKCIVCGAVPSMPATEMCGPCTFGEADTEGGNW